ncbi:C40 family peptidase [Ottowia sp.]|uniref:C40 family peptidase n=1 Tax=Ottowia sp. TaxID=1898956 RepID=UPI003A848EF9
MARRPWMLGLGVSLVLAGCGSSPGRRTSTTPNDDRPATASKGTGVQPVAAPVPPSQPVLDLNPTGREELVARTMLLINTPYTYGGNTPRGGFDCSGLVHYVVGQLVAADAAAARRLPRSTAQWAAATQPVTEAALQRGDLVFFNTTGRAFSHMGIYVGQGQFVHAPSTGGTVRKDAVGSRYFGRRYLGARRVFAG